MSIAANKALFARFYVDIWNTGDIAALDEFLAPDSRNHGLGETTVPHRELYKEAIRETRAGFPDWTNALDGVIAEGDIVAARWRASAPHTGPYGPWAPTGRKVVILGMTFVASPGAASQNCEAGQLTHRPRPAGSGAAEHLMR